MSGFIAFVRTRYLAETNVTNHPLTFLFHEKSLLFKSVYVIKKRSKRSGLWSSDSGKQQATALTLLMQIRWAETPGVKTMVMDMEQTIMRKCLEKTGWRQTI